MKTANKYLVFFYLIFLIPSLIYGYIFKQPDYRNVPQYAEVKATDPRVLARERQRQVEITKVKVFLTKYNSPLKDYADVLVDEAYIYGLDYRLVVSVAGVESTFCKFPAPGTEYNCWGYKSYSSPNGWWRFSNYREGIEKITQTIANDRIYSSFQQSGSIYDLAKTYTENPESWIKSLNYFLNQI